MAAPPVMHSRRRYIPFEDVIILEEVISLNPFDDAAMCVKVAEKLSDLTQVARNVRSVKEMLDLLLAQFLRQDTTNRRKSGTEEEYKAVDRLLQQVADLAPAPGPGRDPGLVDAPGAAPSPGPGTGRDPGSAPDPVPGVAEVPEPSHHPDLSPPPHAAGGNRPSFGPIWCVLKPGANTGAAPAPRNDPPPEQARDAEVIRLRKENDDLKNTINRLVNEMADIKKLVSMRRVTDAAVRASETPIPAPVDGTATSSKRRAVVNQTCESGVLSAEVNEIKQTLTALADSLKQVAPSVTFLTDSVRQIQVALGDPKGASELSQIASTPLKREWLHPPPSFNRY
ncbi:hypothetical protein HPB49_014992 [Dermacentor silvarum]|uniref:Uncharacterized protein n=1 Tax=Dermacentor silvarum TaxID=543639 RepID=A0ACB8DJ36_DERSI|nr:hypothetical protein HPB49_014992 [Dermacentor silvarum]